MEKNRAETVRVQLDLPVERIDDMESIIAKTGMTTRKDLFENALALFEWAVEQRQQGRIIASIDEATNNYREVVMPGLASVRNEAKNSSPGKKQRKT